MYINFGVQSYALSVKMYGMDIPLFLTFEFIITSSFYEIYHIYSG